MKSEKDYENMFIDCVKKQKGHAFKIKMSSINGLPDMYCVMPGFAPVLLEAKLIKDVGAKFKRTIHYSKLQVELLSNCNKVNPMHTVAYGLIFVKDYLGLDVCMLMEPEIPTITHNDVIHENTVYIQNGGVNVVNLFERSVPRLHMPTVHENVIAPSKEKVYSV